MIYAIGITKKEIPLKPKEPLPLHHSWPLFDHERHLDLCAVLGADAPALAEALHCPQTGAELARKGVGVWQCDLADNALTWSAGVFDIFGLPRDARVTRADAVALYYDDSRDVMERLRAHAIKHRRGFTIDVEICPAVARRRWMRLCTAPVCEGKDVVRLIGWKKMY